MKPKNTLNEGDLSNALTPAKVNAIKIVSIPYICIIMELSE